MIVKESTLFTHAFFDIRFLVGISKHVNLFASSSSSPPRKCEAILLIKLTIGPSKLQVHSFPVNILFKYFNLFKQA